MGKTLKEGKKEIYINKEIKKERSKYIQMYVYKYIHIHHLSAAASQLPTCVTKAGRDREVSPALFRKLKESTLIFRKKCPA